VSNRWDTYFLDSALRVARMSKDPSTKVGAVVVKKTPGFKPVKISEGFNGFPVGVADDNRLHVREQKLEIVVHAEMNAILTCARLGIATAGCSIYVAACNGAGDPGAWGGPPCARCTVECMQAGIVEYVSWPAKPELLTRWGASIKLAKDLIHEAGLMYREVPLPEYWCTPDADAGCPADVHRCPTCPLHLP
jgi:dCMP deaminase